MSFTDFRGGASRSGDGAIKGLPSALKLSETVEKEGAGLDLNNRFLPCDGCNLVVS